MDPEIKPHTVRRLTVLGPGPPCLAGPHNGNHPTQPDTAEDVSTDMTTLDARLDDVDEHQNGNSMHPD